MTCGWLWIQQDSLYYSNEPLHSSEQPIFLNFAAALMSYSQSSISEETAILYIQTLSGSNRMWIAECYSNKNTTIAIRFWQTYL